MNRLHPIRTVLQTELTLFFQSDPGTFLIHAFILASWSAMMAFRGVAGNPTTDAIWWIFFSIVITSNYTTTTFIAERLNGSWEILLTSGISRSAFLLGKVIFMMILAACWGYACLCLADLGSRLLPGAIRPIAFMEQQINVALFLAASFMNISFGAFMSVTLTNPRLFPFLSMILLSLLVAIYWAGVMQFGGQLIALLPVLLLIGSVFLIMAWRLFHSEKIVRPMVL